MALKNGLYAIITAEGEDFDDYSKCLGAAFVGEIPGDSYLGAFLDWLKERYSKEQAAERSFHISFYYHGFSYEDVDFKKPTEMEMLRLVRKSKMMTHDQREMLDVAVEIAEDIRQIVVETGALPPIERTKIADCSPMIQAATGVGVPDTVEAYEAYIEDSDGTFPNVNVINQLTKKDIADGAFDGTRRALARFITPKDEVPIEKIHRLRCDGVDWKYITRTIYKEEHGKDIDEGLLDSEVKKLQKQHKREYPEFYEK